MVFYLEIALISSIIAAQIFSFAKNVSRIAALKRIFDNANKCSVRYEEELFGGQELLSGIKGGGNATFDSIIATINKYLRHNMGAAIEYGLLKDTVDRHCDAIENDIHVRTPVPLYLGLMGTMLGVIIGLFGLTQANVISNLISSSTDSIAEASENAAFGITSLLQSVAMAMSASLCGIVLTTLSTVRFKLAKLKEEKGKNDFLAWMQAELLPKLPTDTSQAIRMLVNNLTAFNQSFSDNTQSLGVTLSKVNESYASQAEIIKAVQKMDVMRIATINATVLKELSQCTNKLESFNEYLNAINGYTEAIHRFETLFNKEAGRVRVLEEIRDFFTRHKAEINKATVDADDSLKKSLRTIKESTAKSVNELTVSYLNISQGFKDLIRDEKETFAQYAQELRNEFAQRLSQVPLIAEQVKEIAQIPSHINLLLAGIEKTNRTLQESIALQTQEKLDRFGSDVQNMVAEQLDAVNELPTQVNELVERLEESKLLRRKKSPAAGSVRPATRGENALDPAATNKRSGISQPHSKWVSWLPAFLRKRF